jgi:hypothetical protein
MVEVMTHHATQKTAERDDRDQRALVWTVKSLADDDELEPFVEGISAVLWGARGRRKLYDERIMALVYHPEVLLASRIETLLRDCNNGLLPAGVESRRQISSLKALWAMARLSMEKQQSKQPLELFDLSLLEVLCKSSAAAVRRHAVSTHALVQYSTYRSVATGLREVIDTLADSQNPGVGPPSIRFSSALKKIERQMVRLRPSVWLLNSANINYFHGEPPSFISPGVTTDTSSTLSFINEISDRLRFLEDAPGCIFLKFLENSADVDSMPYEFLATCSGIRMAEIPSSSVERTLERIISTHSARLKRHPEIHHIDSIVGILLSLWKPESPSFASTPWIVEYLTSRDSDECLSQALQNLDLNVLRSCIKAYLQVLDSDVSTDNILEAIWRLCVLSRRAGSKSLSGAFDETMLLAVQQSEFSLCSPAVIALIQCDVLDSLVKHPMETLEEKALLMAKLKAPILPARATPHADDPLFLSSFKEVGGTLNMRYTEAGFTILTDFLDGCRSDVLPFHARDTLQYITAFIPRTKLHASHQLRFASSLLGVVQVNTTPAHTEMIAKIIHSSIFDTYARRTSQNHSNTFNASVGTCGGSPAHIEYLDDPDSRRMLTEALRTYAATLPPGQFPTLVSRITAVLSKITISPSNNEPPRLQAPNSRRDFFHTLGVEYRVLRPT